MKSLPTIFLSYNPDSDFEQTLAIRLHTIGAVHGFQMLLPERSSNGSKLSIETQSRINLSDYFILFSTQDLSQTVRDEIEFAFGHTRDRSKVIIIYDKAKGKNLTNTDFCTEIFVDSRKHSTQEILNEILIQLRNNKSENAVNSSPKGFNEDVLAGILLAGLAFLVLGVLLAGSKK